MDYEYDVFLSYKSGKIYGRWVLEVFFDFFKENLEQSLGYETNIFIDKNSIEDGDEWQARIKNSLIKSKCVVAVLSPLYFKSEWCKRECATILFREEKLGYRSITNPSGLFSAVVLHDGDMFPQQIKNVQSRLWHDYALVGKGFENTEIFIDFQKELKKFANNVASLIKSAPPFSNEWLDDKWIEEPFNKYRLDLEDKMQRQPVL